MRLTSIRLENHPPVALFDIDGLSDVVVIGGPNGVGKTRLVQHLLSFLQNATPKANVEVTVAATCKEEREAWGQDTLRTSDAQEAAKFNGPVRNLVSASRDW